MKKILIVDDEPMMLKITARALKDRYETILASSGSEALKLFKSGMPDLVISDIKMPEMSGIELHKALKENGGAKVPFIFMSADENDESENIGRELGAADFIRKPVKADVLLERVGIVLERAIWGEINNPSGADVQAKAVSEDPEVVRLRNEKQKLPEWILHSPLMDINEGFSSNETAEDLMSAINVFLDHAQENTEELDRCYSEDDITNYTIKVHALKSTSRLIGAMILSAMAAALERAGDDKNSKYIKQEHELFMDEYRKYIHVLKGKEDNSSKEKIDEDALKDTMMALKEYTDAEDYTLVKDAIDYLSKYCLPPDVEKKVENIKLSLNRLDWDSIHGMML